VLLTRVVTKQGISKTAETASRVQQGGSFDWVPCIDLCRLDLLLEPAHGLYRDALLEDDRIVIGG